MERRPALSPEKAKIFKKARAFALAFFRLCFIGTARGGIKLPGSTAAGGIEGTNPLRSGEKSAALGDRQRQFWIIADRSLKIAAQEFKRGARRGKLGGAAHPQPADERQRRAKTLQGMLQ